MEDPAGSVEVHMKDGRADSRRVVSYDPETDWELSVTTFVSTVAFLGMGRVLVGDLLGLTLVERPPFSSFFTSSSSVHRVEGDALWRRVRISVSLLGARPLEEEDAISFLVYSGDEFPLELPSYPTWRELEL